MVKINDGHLIETMKEMTGLPRCAFGAGYPYKRWQDAVAEIAWNRHGTGKHLCWQCVLAGDSKIPKHKEAWIHTHNFATFKSAFLKWLDEYKNPTKI